MKPPLMLTAEQTPQFPVEPGPAPEPPRDTAVLIVGAGPTGLTLAAFLAERDIPFVIVDRRPAGSTASRGAVIHSRTLQVLDRVGVGAALVERGVIMPRFTMRQRHRAMLTVPFGGVPGPYGYSASVPQNVTEKVFTTHLAAGGNQVHRGWEVVELQVDAGQGSSPDQVSAVLVDGAGRRRSITARFLVGCDGLHSRVRELSGIGFTGTRYSQTFEMADVRMDWPLPRDGVDLTMSADGLLVVFPLPDGVFRIIATVRSGTGQSGEADAATGTATAEPEGQVSPEQLQRILDRRGPLGRRTGRFLTRSGRARPELRDVLWTTRFSIQNRLADTFRSGPVFLAGDAAHVYSPAGGQGMNLGIRDAAELGEVLSDVLSGRRDPDHLDTYNDRRRPLAQDVVTLTDRMTRAVTLTNPVKRGIRNAVVTLMGLIPPLPGKLATKLSGHAEPLFGESADRGADSLAPVVRV